MFKFLFSNWDLICLENLTVLEHGVRNLKKQISLDKSQPESLRKEMQVQLAIPLKHKQVEVIDMDTSDDAPL